MNRLSVASLYRDTEFEFRIQSNKLSAETTAATTTKPTILLEAYKKIDHGLQSQAAWVLQLDYLLAM